MSWLLLPAALAYLNMLQKGAKTFPPPGRSSLPAPDRLCSPTLSQWWSCFTRGLLLLACLLKAGPRARAQNAAVPPAGAEAYVRQFEASYGGVRSLRADFTQIYAVGGQTRLEAGVVWFARGGLMRWDYQRPSAKLFLSDGKHLWLYIPEERQLSRSPVKFGDDLRVPFRLLLTRLDLRRVFARVEFADEVSHDPGTRLLRGFPKKAYAEDYQDVLMELDDRFDMRRLDVDLPDHSRMEFRFDHIRRNPPLEKSLFHFTPPPGTTVIDER